jgi:single-stranded-DNA-specific exonuclease
MTAAMTPIRWLLPDAPDAATVAAYGGCPPLIAGLLHTRGIPHEDAHAFLDTGNRALGDPFLLPGMDAAVRRIRAAHERHESICVYGDYDADGLTAQALLVTALRAWGVAPVRWFTPHRERDGYGLHDHTLEQLAREGVRLVIAVDCGISNVAEIALARSRGLDVIVIDHHQVPAVLPDAVAVVNPQMRESAYPFRDLAGVGVTYALVRALARSGAPFARPDAALLSECVALAAIGTVADVVPLHGENRIIVRAGIRALRGTRHAGLLALCERAGIRIAEVDAGHISFALAPRLNAPGRVRGVEDAHRLLLPTSEVEARLAAVALDEANRDRQDETRRALEEAVAMVEAEVLPRGDRVLLVGSEGWNIGIVGLVAAKLVERYHRPALVYARGESESRGSARSIAAFDIGAALAASAPCLTQFGGHPRAAGFTVANTRIEALRQSLLGLATTLSPDDLAPTLRIDAALEHAEVSLATCGAVAAFGPFGHGNPEPVFLVRGARVVDARRVGADETHLMFRVALANGARVRCIAFSHGPRERELLAAHTVDLAAILQRDEWQGDIRLQLRVRDFRPTQA